MSSTPHAPRRSAAEQRRLEAALAELFEHLVTFNQTLGLKVVRLGPGGPQLRFEMRPELVGHYQHGRLHGGVISATLDAMAGLAIMVALGEKHPEESADQVMHRFSRLGTIDLRVDYLRPGIGRHFVASAEVMRLGGRVGSAQMRLVNDADLLVATGTASYMLS
ncbi:MAG: thioesterase family protein [Burkholderiales bacterium]|nr:MAG: thioesterase family protein [Burkholderiales bacterium]